MENSGIYAIVCTKTGEQYIGSSINIWQRWSTHLKELRVGKHRNLRLQKAWDKYGKEKFSFSIVEPVEDVLKLSEREQYWIDTLQPKFNIALYVNKSSFKEPHSSETKRLISESNKEYWAGLSEEEREIRRQKASHPVSDDVKRILSEKSRGNTNMLGKTHSAETRSRLSAATKSQFAEQIEAKKIRREEFVAGAVEREEIRREKIRISNTGKTPSDATKERLRQVALAQQADPEYRAKHKAAMVAVMSTSEMRAKLSQAAQGKVLSQEHRNKIGASHIGTHRSEETKQHMAEARRLWWAKRKAAKPQS